MSSPATQGMGTRRNLGIDLRFKEAYDERMRRMHEGSDGRFLGAAAERNKVEESKTEPRFYRVRLEKAEVAAWVAAQRAIEAEHGLHPYAYPVEVKAEWLKLNDLIVMDAKIGQVS